MAAPTEPILPDYGGACVTNLVPALCEHPDAGRGWLPSAATSADRVVLLVVDGLGWDQVVAHRDDLPTLAAMEGGPITSVVPSTTATALTSITTGVPPGEHGVVGYRIDVGGGEVLNALRWRTPAGDARERIVPEDFSSAVPFAGRTTPIVSPAAFVRSGLTRVHLRNNPYRGYHAPSSIPLDVAAAFAAGERFVYAYYDGVDKIAHIHGLGDHHHAELVAVDRLVADLLAALGSDVAVVVTADHGLTECRDDPVELDAAVLDAVRHQSGEARMRWLHVRPGATEEVAGAARETLDGIGWVWTREEFVAAGFLGPTVTDEAAGRLGDVVLAAQGAAAFADPDDNPSIRLLGRHGSLTRAEMLVPALVAMS